MSTLKGCNVSRLIHKEFVTNTKWFRFSNKNRVLIATHTENHICKLKSRFMIVLNKENDN